MGSFGDKPHSSLKPRRLVRRLLTLLALVVGGVALAAIAGMLAFKSEAFWRSQIFGAVFGPYWDTSISWEKFESHAFPPGITITGLSIHEPNAPEQYLLRATRLDFRGGLDTRPGYVDLQRLEMEGLSVRYVLHGDDDSNLSRVLNRVFEGRNPLDSSPRIPDPEQWLWTVDTDDFEVDGFTYAFEDRRPSGDPVVYRFESQGPTRVFSGPEAGDHPRRLTDYFSVESFGEFTVRRGEVLASATGNLSVEVPRFADYPQTTLELNARLQPPRGESRFSVMATLPLERSAVRLKAIPLENIEADLMATAGTPPLFTLREGTLDPLTGEIRGAYYLGTESDVLWRSLGAFIAPAGLRALEDRLAHLPLGEDRVRLETSGRLAGEGILQYAIVDEAERLPLNLDTTGRLDLEGFRLGALDALGRFVREPGIEHDAPLPLDIGLEWFLDIEERARSGALRLAATARPTGIEGVIVRTSIADPADPDRPITFNPFVDRGPQQFLTVIQRQLATLPVYTRVTSWEAFLGATETYLFGLLDAIGHLGMEDMSIRQEIELGRDEALGNFLRPVLGDVTSAESGVLRVGAQIAEATGEAVWLVELDLLGVELGGLEGPIDFEGRVRLAREGSRVRAEEMWLQLARRQSDGRLPRTMRLVARGGSADAEEPANFVDFDSGRLRFDLELTSVRRELLEVLERLQSFSIADGLAQPVSRRLLDLLGLRPGDPAATTQMRARLRGRFDEKIRIAAEVEAMELPLAPILEGAARPGGAPSTVTVRWDQQIVLDPESGRVAIDGINAGLFADAGATTPVLQFRFAPEDLVRLDLPRLGELLRAEAAQLSAGGHAHPRPLPLLVAGFLDRLAAVRGTLREGEAVVDLSIHQLDLAPHRGLLAERGIPIIGGHLSADLRIDLVGEGRDPRLGGVGTLRVDRLALAGLDEPVRELTSDFTFEDRDGFLHIGGLASTLTLRPGEPPVTLSCTTGFHPGTGEEAWTLRIDPATPGALAVLANMESNGVARAAQVFHRLPLSQLADLAGDGAPPGMHFSGRRPDARSPLSLRARLTGNGLDVLPGVLRPLGMEAKGDLVVYTDGATVLGSLSASLREEGTEEPLIAMELGEALLFPPPGEADGLVRLRLDVAKDLARLAPRLADFPLPPLGRPISGGAVAGVIELDLPVRLEQALDVPARSTRFLFRADDLALAGHPQRFESVIGGTLRSQDGFLILSPGRWLWSIDGERAGEVVYTANVEAASRVYRLQLDLRDFGPGILAAMPGALAPWASLPGARLAAALQLNGSLGGPHHVLTLEARARDLGLPPPALEIPPPPSPPLHADLSLTAAFDGATSQVLLSLLDARVAYGELDEIEAGGPLPENLPQLIRLEQPLPLALSLENRNRVAFGEEAEGLRATVGPVPLEQFRGTLARLAGLPIHEGLLEGEVFLSSTTGDEPLVDQIGADLRISGGRWGRSDGATLPFTSEMRVRLGTRPGARRLEELAITMNYPNEPARSRDHLMLSGVMDRTSGLDGTSGWRAMATVRSESLAVDRLLGLVGDVQALLPEGPPGTAGEDDDGTRVYIETLFANVEDVSAELKGRLENLTFGQIAVTGADFGARVDKEELLLEGFRALLEEGEIVCSGRLEFDRGRLPWDFDLAVDGLALEPWVDTFAPVAAEQMEGGQLSAEVRLAGNGFRPVDLRESLNGFAGLKLLDWRPTFREGPVPLDLRAPLSVEGTVLLRRNTGVVRLVSLWHPECRIRVDGRIQPLFPARGTSREFRALTDYLRTTVVGPGGRFEVVDGRSYPLRQPVYGVLLETEGRLGPQEGAETRLRSLNY